MSDRTIPCSLAALPPASGFRADPRFGAAPPPLPESGLADPVAAAFDQGFIAGYNEAERIAGQAAAAEAAAHEKLCLSFARLDAALEEELRLRLRDTVTALCEATIAPLALDEDALVRRIGKAVAMLARADDNRVIRLHPDDLALVSRRLAAEWQVEPDESLERGALRIDTGTGGVEDGPAQWRRAIAEALHAC